VGIVESLHELSASVPEPTASVLVSFGIALILVVRTRLLKRIYNQWRKMKLQGRRLRDAVD